MVVLAIHASSGAGEQEHMLCNEAEDNDDDADDSFEDIFNNALTTKQKNVLSSLGMPCLHAAEQLGKWMVHALRLAETGRRGQGRRANKSRGGTSPLLFPSLLFASLPVLCPNFLPLPSPLPSPFPHHHSLPLSL